MQKFLDTRGINLLLIDEFARGTNPEEGEALFHALINYFLNKNKDIVITATHFNPPKDIKNCSYFQMKGLHKSLDDDFKKMTMTEKLLYLSKAISYQPIECDQSEKVPKSAILISELLGLESEIIEYAKKHKM